MFGRKRDTYPSQSDIDAAILNRRALLKGAVGVATLAALTACGANDTPKGDPTYASPAAPSPEATLSAPETASPSIDVPQRDKYTFTAAEQKVIDRITEETFDQATGSESTANLVLSQLPTFAQLSHFGKYSQYGFEGVDTTFPDGMDIKQYNPYDLLDQQKDDTYEKGAGATVDATNEDIFRQHQLKIAVMLSMQKGDKDLLDANKAKRVAWTVFDRNSVLFEQFTRNGGFIDSTKEVQPLKYNDIRQAVVDTTPNAYTDTLENEKYDMRKFTVAYPESDTDKAHTVEFVFAFIPLGALGKTESGKQAGTWIEISQQEVTPKA